MHESQNEVHERRVRLQKRRPPELHPRGDGLAWFENQTESRRMRGVRKGRKLRASKICAGA